MKLFQNEAFLYINQLGRFFVWRRKYFVQLLLGLLTKAQETYGALQMQHDLVNHRLEQKQADLLATQLNLEFAQQSLTQNQQVLAHARQEFDVSQQQLKQTKQCLINTQNQLTNSQQELLRYQKLWKRTELDLVYAKHYLVKRRRQLNLTQNILTDTQVELKTTQQNLQAMQKKHQLIANLVSIERPINEGLVQFKKLLQQEYINFINHDTSSSDKHTALIQLKLIEQELELITGFPEIYSKKIIAVSGGFSSGKSEFVNSFINDKAIQLAVGIQPMTAIPTYVIASQKTSVKGYSVNGGSIHLDIGTYKSISHDFMKELGFDLKKLMPFMSLGVDMDEELFKDICLIDTPGYNPSKTGSTDDDSKTASHYVGQADALIWVIGLDSNGTISTSDLDFIKNLNLGEKPLFFVLNKADLRSEDDIQSILDEVANTLDDEDINFTGICSYSSFTKQILVYDRINVHDFIKEINILSSVHHDLYVKIDQIFDHYQNSIEHDIKVRKDIILKMKSIRLDILETNHEDLYKRTENRFGEMSSNFDTVKLEQNLLDLCQLKEAFKQAIIMTTRGRQ